MKIKAYIDTNIYIYVALRNTSYYSKCKRILRDMINRRFEAFGSNLIAIEILGSLSKINTHIARGALKAYLSMPIRNLDITNKVLLMASYINECVNVRYDAIHAVLMFENNICNIITNDVDNWRKIKENIGQIKSLLEENKIMIDIEDLNIITPYSYLDYVNL